MGTLLERGDLERGPGASGGLLEDQRDAAPHHALLLATRPTIGLEVDGQRNEPSELVSGEVDLLQEIPAAQVHAGLL